MLDLQRKALNTLRLQKMNPVMRRRVAAVIRDLEGHGWKPLVDAQVWRSPAQQAALKAAGRSKVSFSFHNCTTKDGKPDSCAADIVDARWLWNSPRKYWLMLRAAAKAHGCTTGAQFGLSSSERFSLGAAILNRDFDAKVAIGWDPSHIEPEDLSLSEARFGVRPQ